METDLESVESDPNNTLKIIAENIRNNDDYPLEEIILNDQDEMNDDSDNESDVDEKEFTKLSIRNEKFVKFLNKLFLLHTVSLFSLLYSLQTSLNMKYYHSKFKNLLTGLIKLDT